MESSHLKTNYLKNICWSCPSTKVDMFLPWIFSLQNSYPRHTYAQRAVSPSSNSDASVWLKTMMEKNPKSNSCLSQKNIWLHTHWSTHPCGNCKKLHTCPLFDNLHENYANLSFKFIYLSYSLDRLASKFLPMINRSSRKEGGPENIIL
jgi:hypothetical protein